MQPTTRDEFKEYCLRRLGSPVINIVIDPDQIEDAVDSALYLFFSRHMDATEEKYIAHMVSDEEIDTGVIVLPESTQAVTAVWRNGSTYSSDLFGVPYQIFLDDYLSGRGMYSTEGGGLTYYYLSVRYITSINDFFNPDVRFNYNKLNRKLRITGLDLNFYKTTPLVIQTLERIATQAEIDGEEESVIWADSWLKEYATAQMKRTWGTNMKKYQNVALLGGVMMDGQTIFEQAELEIEKLELQLQNAYEEPVDMHIG